MTKDEMKSCAQIHELLEEFLSGKLESELLGEVQSHLDACPDCADLVSILSGDLAVVDTDAPSGLVASVLERTTGRACSEASLSLPSFVDEELDEVDGNLVSLHLEGCHECRSLERALRRMSADLPILAEAEPAPRFAPRVFDATSGRVTQWESFINVWRGIVRRPRFAFEVAYAAMLVLVLILGINGTGEIGRSAASFMRAASSRAASAQGEVVEQAAQRTAGLTGAIANRVASGAREGVTSGRTLVRRPTESLKERAGGVSKWLKDRWRGLAGSIETKKIQSDKDKEIER